MARITQCFIFVGLTFITALGLDCPNCNYFSPSVTGSDEVKAALESFSRTIGSELCQSGENITTTCSTEGFCVSVMYAREVSFDIADKGSGVYTFDVTLRKCADGNPEDQCESEVDLGTQFNSTYQQLLTVVENATATDPTSTWECCQNDTCITSQVSTTAQDMDGSTTDGMGGTETTDSGTTTRAGLVLMAIAFAVLMSLLG